MGHWRKRVSRDSKHLYHWDLEGVSPLVVEIEGVEDDEVYNNGETSVMLFLRFKGGKKTMGVNVTNATIIESVTGESDPEKWVGKTITLRRARCRDEECIRVDVPQGTKLPGSCPKFTYVDVAKTNTKGAN